jgi:arsenate reductase-like glutaredoxin family protein
MADENVQNAEREVQAAQKPDFSLLSNDPLLNSDLGVTTIEQKQPEVKQEEKPEEKAAELTLEKEKEVVSEEKPIEEAKEEGEKVEELKLDEAPLVLDEKPLEEGSWQYVAKELGIEGMTEDTPQAFIEAVATPLKQEIEALKAQKIDEFLVDVDPEIKLEVYLAKTGMTKEEIRQPFIQANNFRTMDPVALVRADLEAQYDGKAKPEWIDSEMEALVSKDGAIEHERERILMQVETKLESIVAERQELYNKYNTEKEAYTNNQKKQEVEAISKSLNDMSTFMGKPLPEEIRKQMSANYAKGQYNDLLNDQQAKAEFIVWKKLGSQIQKNIEAESYNRGRSEITKKLHNTPPLETGGAGKSTTQEVKGNFDKLKGDPLLGSY